MNLSSFEIFFLSFPSSLKYIVHAAHFSAVTKSTGYFFGQIGSGFGQSLIVADFNNDNKDDIAVGAPMEGEDDMNKVDVGAVYIYYGTRDGVRVCMRTCVVQHMLVYFECITLICVFY